MNQPTSPEITLALQGLHRWADAYHRGNWQPYMELLTDDYTFRVVSGKKLSKTWDVRAALSLHNRLTVDREPLYLDEPIRMLQQENTVLFEFEDNEHEFGAAFSFDLRGGKIAACRAYLCLS